ncbi:MAG TPA: T9SS type A sorting domain-containing protein [Bacteroidia bacterium]
MRVYLAFIFYMFVASEVMSQSYINYVLGKYSVIMSHSALQSNMCPGILHLTPHPIYAPAIYQSDSCFTNHTENHQPWAILVQADSTFVGYEPWAVSAAASGKLYANDSIYLRVKDFSTNNPDIEYWGFKLYSTVGIEDLSKPENELLVSPQPANDVMYVQSTQMRFSGKPVLYDMSGKQVNTEMHYVNANTYKADVSQLSPGIYFIFVLSDKGYVKKKVLIQD